ncbi:MAG: hypothetical protein K7J46_11490 [Bryobacter sp.]|nr:hypothetical protein [Bryobacter sp. CoA8 C33]
MRRLALFVLLLSACSSGPGLTPVEQESLSSLAAPLSAPLLFTVDSLPPSTGPLLPILAEYRRTPLRLHIVWRTPQPPSTQQLALFPGKSIRQYWDPSRLTPSSQNQLRTPSGLVPLENLPLRLALARAAALPQ